MMTAGVAVAACVAGIVLCTLVMGFVMRRRHRAPQASDGEHSPVPLDTPAMRAERDDIREQGGHTQPLSD
jgi:hypothetical protein